MIFLNKVNFYILILKILSKSHTRYYNYGSKIIETIFII